MKLLIKKAGLLKKGSDQLEAFDVLINEGKVEEIGQEIVAPGASVIDAQGKVLVPGLVDVHVHFREPGQEYKEDLRTGSLAAAAGGFTTVIGEPNTTPPIDTPSRLRRLLDEAERKSIIHFNSKAAITKGLMGKSLADIINLKKAGAKAISDDGNPVPTRTLMRNALLKATECGIPVSPHCEESASYREKMHHHQMPYVSPGARPYTSEAGFIQRDIELAEATGSPVHFSHVSLAKSVEMIAHAKKRGVKVTAEVTPQHLVLTDRMAEEIGPNAKVNPPLRTDEDVAAIREGLASGAIDIIASDHAPHSPEEKNRPWDQAPFGVIGLETTLGVILTFLVRPGLLTLNQAIEKMTIMPARIFGLDQLGVGSLGAGVKADLTLIDLDKKWKVDASRFYSKGRNCPFDGWELYGKAILTLVDGRIVAKDGNIVPESTSRGQA
ncbi:MAG: dihydroorotase [Thermodesulfobacteriota bacterium]